MADKFLFNPFNRLFCSGKCTFIPEMTTRQNKIVIVDFPMLEYGHETGRLINVLIKLVFQRAWLRRKVSEAPTPVFLWQDEFQYFVTRWDNFFQQTCRGARVAVVCLTQSILNLSEELGEQQPGSKTKAFLGNLMLKIFHQQNDPDTCTFGAEQIGKQYKYLDSYNMDATGGATTGGAQQLVYNVEPITFSQLMKPDGMNPLSTAIVYQGGKAFNATVTRENPQGRNYLTVAFSRDI
jgi:type IV secretory pathway TraG/TraD family ATPase VirD4